MSTTVRLHERVEGMTDNILSEHGVVGTGFSKTSEEFDELLIQADDVKVGINPNDDGADAVGQLFRGVEEVTERKIAQVETTIENSEDVNNKEEILNWLTDHMGEEVFTIYH